MISDGMTLINQAGLWNLENTNSPVPVPYLRNIYIKKKEPYD